jgi:hypothetical protein
MTEIPESTPEPSSRLKHPRAIRSKRDQVQPAVPFAGHEAANSDITDQARERRAAIDSVPVYEDYELGLRIVYEMEIAPGETSRRVRIEFEQKPPRVELDIVKREGFRWAKDVEAWVMENGPRARELAKKALNLVYKQRGIDCDPVRTPSR